MGLSIRRLALTNESHVATGVGQVSFLTIGLASPMGTSDADKAADLRGILPDVGQQVPDQESDGHRGR